TSVTLEFNNDRDIDKAAVDVQAALLRAQKRLPIEMTIPPSYRKINPADTPVIIIRMSSPSISLSEINDYAENLMAPNLSTISGVSQVNVYGAKRYAIRISAQPDALGNRNITMDELAAAINKANTNSPIGTLDGPRQLITIYANPQLVKAEEFGNLIIAQRNGFPVYLKDVAIVEESYEDVKTFATAKGLKAQLPESIQLSLINDRSTSIIESIHDVNITLLLTIALVVLVIFLFLKNIAATVIPSISLPISLIGAFFVFYFMGYSLDNISLLGITLAVGLVVDDAIVVLENIMRYIESGMSPLKAALKGSKEVGFTIVSISLSLVAVFIPLFFMAGPIGLLFREFAVVVTLSILVSAVVSLTIVPMLCSRFLKEQHGESKSYPFTKGFDRIFTWSLNSYTHYLDLALVNRKKVLWGTIATFIATIALFAFSPKGFFPEEDIGQLRITVEAAQDTSFKTMLELQDRAAVIVDNDPNVETSISILGGGMSSGRNTGRFFVILKPKSERQKMSKVM
ncbi:MAG: acriflavine resistance protein B, partial [Polynucleobacter sp. 24-46-87]